MGRLGRAACLTRSRRPFDGSATIDANRGAPGAGRSPLMHPLSLVVLAGLLLLTAPVHGQAVNSLDRPRDPVVLRGSRLPEFQGHAPGEIVAFRYSGDWVQIPVQVDERLVLDFAEVYGRGGSTGLETRAYADPDTYVGEDPDPAFDDDDELVFMAADAGDEALFAEAVHPDGVEWGSGLELRIVDPATGDEGFVYLFTAAGLDPAAGADYVSYDFHLLSGSYLDTYNTRWGPNPEDSVVETGAYSQHFSDRWVKDELRITAGAATGVDILDRHKFLFAPGDCTRSEDTFTAAEGAFFANVDGPVRAIRSYLGANSGYLSQRNHFFYAEREDMVTFLRVHSIPGVMDLHDYSPAAIGMTYQRNPYGWPAVIDGAPDAFTAHPVEWELVTGEPGSFMTAVRLNTDIQSLDNTFFYSDDVDSQYVQCTGDGSELATSGLWAIGPLPNTDPLTGANKHFTILRSHAFAGPGATVADARLHYRHSLEQPLEVETDAFPVVDTILLAGPASAPSGTPLDFQISGAPPDSPLWLYVGREALGAVINGQLFDLGPGYKAVVTGMTGPGGGAAWTGGPVPSRFAGVTFFLEARADSGGETFDSNLHALEIQ